LKSNASIWKFLYENSAEKSVFRRYFHVFLVCGMINML